MWAVVDLRTPPGPKWPGKIVDAGSVTGWAVMAETTSFCHSMCRFPRLVKQAAAVPSGRKVMCLERTMAVASRRSWRSAGATGWRLLSAASKPWERSFETLVWGKGRGEEKQQGGEASHGRILGCMAFAISFDKGPRHGSLDV